MPVNSLNLLLWNARGVLGKRLELSEFLSQREIDIAVLTETFLKPGTNFNLPGFTFIRFDRTHSGGGGVALAIKKNIKFNTQPFYQTSIIESLGIEVETDVGWIQIIAAYCPKQCYDGNGMARKFKNDLAKLTRSRRKFIIACDLNAKHEAWNNCRRNRNGCLLADDSLLGYYTVHGPGEPTFLSPAGVTSTIDVFLTNMDNLSQPRAVNDLSSDHFPVLLEFGGSIQTRDRHLRNDYHNVNWIEFQRKVDRLITGDRTLNTTNDIDKAIEDFRLALAEAEAQCVRKVPIRDKLLKIDNMTRAIIRQRNKVRRQFQRSGDLSKKYIAAKLTKLISVRVDKIKNDNFSKQLHKLEPFSRPFWKVAKILKSKPQQVPPLALNDNILITAVEKANAIGEHILSSHNLGSSIISPMEPAVYETLETLRSTPCHVPENKRIKPEQIALVLKNRKNMKAPGFDAIFNLVLKKLSSNAHVFLANILNRCLELHYFPTEWKTAKVIPLLKPGKDPTSPTSYRPISLLSSLSKLFEGLILDRVLEHIESNNILPPEQFGFRKGHSTTHQLQRVVNIIDRNKSVAKSTAMALLDVEKAFDNMWHDGLVHKLYRHNFPEYIIKIIQNYLNNRKFHVSLLGSKSDAFGIPAGVPQGSLLGPILYSVYTSDFPRFPADTQLCFFADDTAVLCNGRVTRHLTRKLQVCLDMISNYMNCWKIRINAAKTQAILFPLSLSPKHVPPADCKISINTIPINWSKEVVYLGLTLDQKLLFRSHIEKIQAKTNLLLKKLYPLIKRNSALHQKNKLAIYKQIVLPLLKYALPVWKRCADTHKNKLQVIQNNFLKMILNLPRFTRTSLVHQQAETATIKELMEAISTKFINKCSLSEFPLINTLFVH